MGSYILTLTIGIVSSLLLALHFQVARVHSAEHPKVEFLRQVILYILKDMDIYKYIYIYIHIFTRIYFVSSPMTMFL